MITTSSKWFFGLGLVSLVLAAAYGWTTGGTGLGPVSLGYKGGVGDHFGYGVLVSIAAVAMFLGVVAVLTRDADADALADLVGTDTAPAPVVPTGDAFWPVVGAFGAGIAGIGLVVSNVLFVGGMVVCAVVLLEWSVLAWSDRATGDPAANRLLRNRLMAPFEVPLAGFVGIGVLVVAFSRVLLASSELGAVWVAVAVAVVVLAVGSLVASRPRVSPNVVAGVLLVGALATVAGGIVAGASGERTYHSVFEHEEDQGDGERIEVQTPGATGIGESSAEAEPSSPATTEAPEEGAS